MGSHNVGRRSYDEQTNYSLDGLSFYRAIARQYIGDPTKYTSILNQVLEHYLRAFVDDQHPLHSEYVNLDADFTSPTFFEALSRPDPVLCPCRGHLSNSGRVLSVITNALNVKVVVRNERAFAYQKGRLQAPESVVKFRALAPERCEHRCSSLTAADDGRAIIELLERRKQEFEQSKRENFNQWDRDGLDIKLIAWYSDLWSFDGYRCWSEWQNPDGDPPDLRDNLDSLTVFTVSVDRPQKVKPALRLLEEAIERAPGQEVPVQQTSGIHRPLKRYVAVDAEFRKVYLQSSEEETTDGQAVGDEPPPQQGEEETTDGRAFGDEPTPQQSSPTLPLWDEEPTMVDDSRETAGQGLQDRYTIVKASPTEEELGEDLCSVLTVAVDRHLVFSFYLLDMLKNAENTTVDEVYSTWHNHIPSCCANIFGEH